MIAASDKACCSPATLPRLNVFHAPKQGGMAQSGNEIQFGIGGSCRSRTGWRSGLSSLYRRYIEARVWSGQCDDIPAAAEAPTLDKLLEKVSQIALDMTP